MIFLTIILYTNIVYAKYIKVDKISSAIGVVTPIFIVEGEQSTKISEINNIGYYEFTIKNFNETNISEVGFWYTIEVLTQEREDIQFELYNEETQIPLENLKTEKLLIKGNEEIEQKYKLKVIYNNITGKEILEEVQVKVHSEQEKI